MRRRVILPLMASVLILGVGILLQLGRLSPTAALSFPLDAPFTPTVSPTPTVASDEPSLPGGLGNRRRDLESVFGSPTGLRGTMIAYLDGEYAVTYTDGRATSFLISYRDSPVPLTVARKAARSRLPPDSIYVGTLRAGPSRIADVYRSARLAAIVPSLASLAPRGQLVVVYDTNQAGAVADVLLNVGGIPPVQ